MARGDKTSSASPASIPLQNQPINDDTWDPFILAIIPDASSTDNCESSLEAATTKLKEMYDVVATGYRTKFCVLDKADVVAWALENAKVHESCKELKAVIDSGISEDDIPDAVLAKVLKLRLVILKQEGVEAKIGAAKAQKETPEAAVTPSEPVETPPKGAAKPGKKEEKKDDKKEEGKKDDKKEKEDARSKTPAGAAGGAKKGAKGAAPAPAKAPETPSRPESAATPPDASKRKQKLRDRGTGKAENRPASIGDEPSEGPDVYYLLRSFTSPTLYDSLIEDHEVPMNLFIRLSVPSDSATPSQSSQTFKTTTNSTITTLRTLSHNSPATSLWKHLAWTDILSSSSQDSKSLFDTIAQCVYALLEKKKIYEGWYSRDAEIVVPGLSTGDGNGNGEGAKDTAGVRWFEHVMKGVGWDEGGGVDLVVGVLCEGVGRENDG
ncbi:hypothetical protein HK097_000646, partial [Rhizophlyctis rosea]